jgi:hypothetical protein
MPDKSSSVNRYFCQNYGFTFYDQHVGGGLRRHQVSCQDGFPKRCLWHLNLDLFLLSFSLFRPLSLIPITSITVFTLMGVDMVQIGEMLMAVGVLGVAVAVAMGPPQAVWVRVIVVSPLMGVQVLMV